MDKCGVTAKEDKVSFVGGVKRSENSGDGCIMLGVHESPRDPLLQVAECVVCDF